MVRPTATRPSPRWLSWGSPPMVAATSHDISVAARGDATAILCFGPAHNHPRRQRRSTALIVEHQTYAVPHARRHAVLVLSFRARCDSPLARAIVPSSADAQAAAASSRTPTGALIASSAASRRQAAVSRRLGRRRHAHRIRLNRMRRRRGSLWDGMRKVSPRWAPKRV